MSCHYHRSKIIWIPRRRPRPWKQRHWRNPPRRWSPLVPSLKYLTSMDFQFLIWLLNLIKWLKNNIKGFYCRRYIGNVWMLWRWWAKSIWQSARQRLLRKVVSLDKSTFLGKTNSKWIVHFKSLETIEIFENLFAHTLWTAHLRWWRIITRQSWKQTCSNTRPSP